MDNLFPLTAATLAAISFIFTEIVIQYYGMPPLLVIVLGNIVGGIVLLMLSARTLSQPGPHREPRTLLTIIAGGVCIYAVAYLFSFNAIALIGAGKTALFGQLETLFVVLFAMILLGERLTRRRGIAGGMALSGTILINVNSEALTFDLGVIFAIIAPLCVAIGIITLKPVLDRVDAGIMTGFALLCGAFALMPFLPLFVPSASFQLSGGAMLFVTVMGLFRGGSWFAYNLGLPRIGAAQSAIIFISYGFFTLLLQLLFAFLWPSLGMQVPDNLLMAFLGGLLIAAGIILIQTEPASLF